jgi:hypothetical protein
MRADVLLWAQGKPHQKLISKETLNHPELIALVSGLDPYWQAPAAFNRAYAALGIDLVNRVPLENAPVPAKQGEVRYHPTLSYSYTALGVYDTAMRHTYACRDVDEVWQFDVASLKYDDLITPVPHPCRADDIKRREQALGEIGLYYPMLYTTVFMWAVEVLGWEVFLLAAGLEPERFHANFLAPCAAKSRAIALEMAQASSSPFVFLHDDLAMSSGPVFPVDWYRHYIMPHYARICAEMHRLGRKVILVADGNMTALLGLLVEAGIDGLMFETPATPLEAVIEHFDEPGRFFIGGISTAVLTTGTRREIEQMVYDLHLRTQDCPGFAMASGGGLHGNIPLPNLEAYFDARAAVGATPREWRKIGRNGG